MMKQLCQRVLLLSTLLLGAGQCNAPQQALEPAEPTMTEPHESQLPEVKQWQTQVHASYPHRRDAFTQGLLVYEGELYESDGLSARYGGQSSLRRVDIASGEVRAIHHVDVRYFAEGLARVDDRLIQLTWQAGKAFVYDLENLKPQAELSYAGEGWGLCFDGEQLYMSDGSSTLTVRDPESFTVRTRLAVTLEGEPITRLNELECVGEHIYANVWQTTTLVRIAKSSGVVDAVIDASALLVSAREAANGETIDVLNGIAHNPDNERFYLTGKLWPLLFEVTFVSLDSP